MNNANLQLEGLYLAIAAITNALEAKGVLTKTEIQDALKRAEQAALGEDRSIEDLSPAHRDAMAFPARFLMVANAAPAENLSFYALAKQVGQTKGPHNDQR
ncbi:hypothetical protein [Devosia nitrariae]|uniref:Uncharacterized protein n=1 Tax=Devosia nitrariae TaxID=2071872 RepID=A0ABQ5WD90_9HYPH|nr:hypothetical protein [Devosia nitrariae]GLQ57843.1 hypothetical protein GCM10010862_51020 [Devosia nitrariae]